MGDLLIGIDLGSTAIKVVTVEQSSGKVYSLRKAACPRVVPEPGYFEVDVEAVVDRVLELISDLPQEERRRAVAIGLTGQMGSMVLVDSEGHVVAPCQSIFDTRCAAEARELDNLSGHLLSREANRALTIHTLPKLLWLAHREPSRLVAARYLLLVKDYVRGALTGVWATDPSDAACTLLYDQRVGAWDADLIAELGLSAALCPTVSPSTDQSGALLPGVARRCGLAAGLPVATGAADMAAVQVGVGAAIGDTIVSVGTAAHVIVPTRALEDGLWPAQQYTQALPGLFYKFGAAFSGGLALDWFRALTGWAYDKASVASQGAREAASCPLFMPYLVGAGAPHYRPEAAGAFTGLHLSDGVPNLAAGVIDGLAFEIAGIVDALQPRLGRVYLTGGASRVAILSSTLATVLGCRIEVTVSTEAAGVGAARLAGAAGHGGELPAWSHLTVPVEPCGDDVAFYERLRPRYEEVARSVRGFGDDVADRG